MDTDGSVARGIGFASPDQLGGILGRNTFQKDGVFNVNMSLARTFPIHSDMAAELREE